MAHKIIILAQSLFFKNIFKKSSIFINKSVVAHKIIILARSLFFKKLSIFINKSAMAHKIILLARNIFFQNISKKLIIFKNKLGLQLGQAQGKLY